MQAALHMVYELTVFCGYTCCPATHMLVCIYVSLTMHSALCLHFMHWYHGSPGYSILRAAIYAYVPALGAAALQIAPRTYASILISIQLIG